MFSFINIYSIFVKLQFWRAHERRGEGNNELKPWSYLLETEDGKFFAQNFGLLIFYVAQNKSAVVSLYNNFTIKRTTWSFLLLLF